MSRQSVSGDEIQTVRFALSVEGKLQDRDKRWDSARLNFETIVSHLAEHERLKKDLAKAFEKLESIRQVIPIFDKIKEAVQ